jgi:hypothetical protein
MLKLFRKRSSERLPAAYLRASFIHKAAIIVLLVLVAAGCGMFFPSASTLVAISISPSNPTIQLTKTQQFTATGTFGDSSSRDVSSSVAWKSSDTSKATITGSGLATAVATGTTTISATSGNVSQSTTLTVSTNTTNSITVTAPNGNTALQLGGTGVQLTATANQSGGGTQDVTQSATWTSSNSAVASVSATGFVTPGTTAGSATISAASGGQTGQITITVI